MLLRPLIALRGMLGLYPFYDGQGITAESLDLDNREAEQSSFKSGLSHLLLSWTRILRQEEVIMQDLLVEDHTRQIASIKLIHVILRTLLISARIYAHSSNCKTVDCFVLMPALQVSKTVATK